MTADKELFSRRLKAAIAAKGLNQREVARALGITQQSVNAWCSASARSSYPRGERMEALAKLLGVGVDHFFKPGLPEPAPNRLQEALATWARGREQAPAPVLGHSALRLAYIDESRAVVVGDDCQALLHLLLVRALRPVVQPLLATGDLQLAVQATMLGVRVAATPGQLLEALEG